MDDEQSSSEKNDASGDKCVSKKMSKAKSGKAKLLAAAKIDHKTMEPLSLPSGSQEPLVFGGKRDREVPDGDEDAFVSAESSSDDSYESSKKIRKETTTGKSNETDNARGKKKATKRNRSTDKAKDASTNGEKRRNEKTSNVRKAGSSASAVDSDMSVERNGDALETMDVSDSKESPADPPCKSGCSKNNCSSDKPSVSSSNNCESQPSGSTSNAPQRRRRSRSYRSRVEESSGDERGENESGERGEGTAAAAATKPPGRDRRRASGERRTSGELRDSSRNDSATRESTPTRLARFLATDSDDSDPPATNGRESRSRRSSHRRRSSASRNATANTDPPQPDSAQSGGAAEESVASRVRRRRSGREARLAGRRGSGGASDAGADDAPAADGDVHVRRYTGRRMLLSDLTSSSASSSSSSPSHSDSQEFGDEDSRRSRRRRRQAMPDQVEAEIMAEVKAIKEKPLPKHNFHLTKELINRQYCGGVCGARLRDGCCARFGLNFSQRFYSSLHTVQRLELMSKLDYHQGCVNAVGFSNSGSILVSGSDDLQLALWEWNREKLLVAFPSGHRNNVFQCKFLPLLDDTHIVTCSRDGQVRLSEVVDGTCRATRRLVKHNGPCHKLATSYARPQVVLSAGEDGEVKEADLRQERPNTIAITTDSQGSRVALHSIHNHPINDNQFCVAGRDEYVCVYDRRITTTTAPPVLKYCPENLLSSRPRANVTCAVYSNNGDAIVASYSDDDIYLFDTSLACQAPPTHRYTGHRNSATVKGVNMFGPQSNFVISGSDCGNVFIWSRETEAIVRCFRADESGVVNVLEWHPHMPLLATSGLDNDVKVWIPSNEDAPGEEEENRIAQTVENNLRERRRSSSDMVDISDSRMIMMIWHHMRRMQGGRSGESEGRRRGSAAEPAVPLMFRDSSDDDDDDDHNPFGGSGAGSLQCAPQ